MFGFDDLIPMIPQNMMMEEDRNQRQDVAWHQQWDTQRFNSAEALAQRNWQEQMAGSGYQRAVRDMKAAGLNPMLAYHSGPATAGQGSAASASSTSPSGGYSPSVGRSNAFIQTLQSAAQIKNIEADTDVKHATAENIREGVPTHQVTRDFMAQQIEESKQKVQHSLQDIENLKATERLTNQQLNNLQETIHQIRATVKNLKAHTTQLTAQTGLTVAQETEAQQRIKANIPAMEQALKDLEIATRLRNVPREEQDRAAHDRFTGALGALIRSLTGIGSYLK